MPTRRKYRKRNMGLAETVEYAFTQTELGGPNGDCWEWQRATNARGYPQIKYEGEYVLVSRLVMIHREGEHPDLYVCHNCDNPVCINPDHLRWDTPSANSIERSHRAKRHQKLKLTPNQVRYIRDLLKFGFKQREIADWYHVNKQTISLIHRGKIWSYIT